MKEDNLFFGYWKYYELERNWWNENDDQGKKEDEGRGGKVNVGENEGRIVLVRENKKSKIRTYKRGKLQNEEKQNYRGKKKRKAKTWKEVKGSERNPPEGFVLRSFCQDVLHLLEGEVVPTHASCLGDPCGSCGGTGEGGRSGGRRLEEEGEGKAKGSMSEVLCLTCSSFVLVVGGLNVECHLLNFF